MTSKEVFEFHNNDNLVDEVERGLRKGYWDKTLIPELKKRFKEIKKKEKLLELYKEKDKLKDFFVMGSIRAEKYKKIEKQIKELEK